MPTALSPHFTLEELTRSTEAARHGLDNTPSAEVIANLNHLCFELLEPIRALIGKPIRINSGYRSPAVNEAAHGSTTSDHVHGNAADIEVEGIANGDLAKRIVASGIPFDQIILECYTQGQPSSGWVHVSRRPVNRRQVLTGSVHTVNGKPVSTFVHGIVY